MHDPAIQRADDVSLLRAAQFPEDRSPTAHPIRPESYREINNFYTATVYEKGAEVIRMLAGYLGDDGFRKGMDLYFARHDGQAVTCDDFVTALADATGTDLTAFAGWYSQAGTPRLTVTRRPREGAADLMLEFCQDIPETAAKTPRQPLPVPVRLGLVGGDGQPVPFRLTADGVTANEQVVLLNTARMVQPLYTGGIGDVVPSLLRQFSAPVLLFDDLDSAERRHLVAHDADMFNRWDSAQTLFAEAIVAITNREASADDLLADGLSDGLANSLDDPAVLDQFKTGLLGMPPLSVLEARMAPADPSHFSMHAPVLKRQSGAHSNHKSPPCWLRHRF